MIFALKRFPRLFSLNSSNIRMSSSTAKPHHHPKGGFQNPWPSASTDSFTKIPLGIMQDWDSKRSRVPPEEKRCPVRPLDKQLITSPSTSLLRTTWLGHACFLVQTENLNILTDPVFSDRCSPSQWIGPKRFTSCPCDVSDLPPIDIVLISHNHYDHCDLFTIEKLGNKPTYVVPLGLKALFESNIPGATVFELDWWDETIQKDLQITCVPAQHASNRGLLDRNMTLWAGWVVKSKSKSFYFAGDTGYCNIPRELTNVNIHDKSLENVPPIEMCPAFKEIGDKFGPLDLAMIPIGAYSPRWIFSYMHCSPEDAVCIHVDVKSKKSIGMHWATWILTDEDPTEPPVRLKAEMEKRKLDSNSFVTTEIGETILL